MNGVRGKRDAREGERDGARAGTNRVRRWSGTSRRRRERRWIVKMMCGVSVCALVDRVVTRVRGLTEATARARDAAAKAKQIRRGVKEVVKALKKETKGVCVIAGDISPIDVITHVPILCEEANVPYVYSKEELGAAGMTKRPTSVMLVMPEGAKGSVKMSSSDKKEFDDMYEKIVAKVKSMH